VQINKNCTAAQNSFVKFSEQKLALHPAANINEKMLIWLEKH